jgi:hypothetical protein
MSLSDLANNIQAKTHTKLPFAGGTPLKRLKKLDQRFRIDSGTSIAYLDSKVSIPADNRDAHRPVRYTVADRIRDEIPNQLLHAFPVPGPPGVAYDFELQRAGGIYDAQLLQFLRADVSEVCRRPNGVYAKPEIRPVEIDKIIQESLQVSTASD